MLEAIAVGLIVAILGGVMASVIAAIIIKRFIEKP